MKQPELSIVIAYHNEPVSEIREAVESIKSTIDIDNYEIIIADDCSKKPLVYDDDRVRVVRQEEHLGVGRGLTLGVENARSENVFLQGNDIRYARNGWASKMIEAIEANPKSIICARCVGMNTESPGGMDFDYRLKKAARRNGSTILMYHDWLIEPKKPKHFKNVVECKWLPPSESDGLEEIPCVLGAAYITKKSFFQYVDPWRFHRSWGTLEPMIGLGYWLMGGSNLCHNGVAIGHIFQRSAPRNFQHIMYNKFVAANLFFPDDLRDKLISFLGDNPQVEAGRGVFNRLESSIFAYKKLVEEKIVYDVRDYCDKFNIDLRE
jgi:glycosyltransferase involved in cell wall biosynthesis